jgi:enoyl-CoA hydratase/carnithine racemase
LAEVVEYSVEDGVATVTLNRPDKLNAMNNDMFLRIMAALDRTAQAVGRLITV